MLMTESLSLTAETEKRQAAQNSVFAAIFLTSLKIVVGLLTNSLGILAEAAHSGLDLVAALVTFFAVRLSDKPADQQHRYGHGKIENISALIETLLLLITSVWIIYEALNRLFGAEVEVDASIWAFLVMGISIAVDYTRSRMLLRTAKKHNSQALEADALHFSTDIWSSSVVIAGLIGVSIGRAVPGLAWLGHADAVAAMIVAFIVIFVSAQMGKRSILALIDTAPDGLSDQIKQTIDAIPGVTNCHRVRMRASGPQLFVDVHVFLAGDQSLRSAHDIMLKIEETVKQMVPGADVLVHPDPYPLKVEEPASTP